MTRILLESLTPGTPYGLQLQSVGSDGTSDWSRIFTFTTVQDAIAPNTPGSTAASMDGTSFSLTWAAVTLSSDGSPAYDLDTYVVKVTSSGSGTVGTFKTKQLRFDFSFEMNRALFGTPQANVSLSVAAADVVGNQSAFSTPISQTNAAPAAVTGLTASAAADTILVSWTGVADADLDHYEVHLGTASGFTTSGATLVFSGKGTAVTIRATGYATTYYVKVYAVDVFGTLSTAVQAGPVTPVSPFVIDTTAPAVPTGLSASLATTVDQKTTATVSWTAVANPTNDLQGYVLRYKASADSDYSYMNVDSSTTSVKILVNKPYVNYDFAVRSYDFYANYSAYTSTVTATGATNSAPATPTGMVLAAGVQSVIVQWTENTELDVINGAGAYDVQIDTANTFSTGNLKTVRTSGTIVSFTGLTSNTLYYVHVRAVDSLGLTSSYNTTASTTTGVITNSDIVAGTISGDRITAATLSGDRVIANTLDANTLKANTIVTQNLGVNSTLTMGDASNNGIIKSFGFSTGVTGWQISKTGFEVNQGTIAAAALLIQDSDNVMQPQYADFEFIPSFYTTALTTNAITTSTVTTTTPKFNAQIYHASWTTAGSNPAVYLGVSTTDYNTYVDASTNYILSAWIRNPAAVTTVVRGNVKLSNGTTVQAFSVTPTVSSSTWVRFSGTVAIPAGITTVLPFFDSTTLTTGAGFDLDGIQLEKQISGATTPSPWTPPGSTRVNGGIIRTGTIISSATVTVNSVSYPSWSINTTGAAQFGDVLVRGQINVGVAGDPDAAGSYIQSGNFVTGSTGWRIDSSGAAEFSSGTFRGTISGGTLDIPSVASVGVTTSGRLHVDSQGTFVIPAGTTNLASDPQFSGAGLYSGSVGSGGAVASKDIGVAVVETLDSTLWGDVYCPPGISTCATIWENNSTAAGYVDIPLGTVTALGLAPSTQYTVSLYISYGPHSPVGQNGAAMSGANGWMNIANYLMYEKTTGAVVTNQFVGISGIITTRQEYSASQSIGIYPGVLTTGIQRILGPGWLNRVYTTFTTTAIVGTSTIWLRLPAYCNSLGNSDNNQIAAYTGLQIEALPMPTKYVDGSQRDGVVSGSTYVRGTTKPTINIPNYQDPTYTGIIDSKWARVNKTKLGSGPWHGSNNYVVQHTAASQSFTTAVFADISWVQASSTRMSVDDGPIFNSSTFEFTAPVGGIYMFNTVITWTTNATGVRMIKHLYGAPGSATNLANQTLEPTPGTNSVCRLTTIMYLDRGQAIKSQGYQSSGGALTLVAHSTSVPSYQTFQLLA